MCRRRPRCSDTTDRPFTSGCSARRLATTIAAFLVVAAVSGASPDSRGYADEGATDSFVSSVGIALDEVLAQRCDPCSTTCPKSGHKILDSKPPPGGGNLAYHPHPCLEYSGGCEPPPRGAHPSCRGGGDFALELQDVNLSPMGDTLRVLKRIRRAPDILRGTEGWATLPEFRHPAVGRRLTLHRRGIFVMQLSASISTLTAEVAVPAADALYAGLLIASDDDCPEWTTRRYARNVGYACRQDDDGTAAMNPLVVAFALGAASGIVANWLWRLSNDDPGWFRYARHSCFYKARRRGWQDYLVEVEFDTSGRVVGWQCASPATGTARRIISP